MLVRFFVLLTSRGDGHAEEERDYIKGHIPGAFIGTIANVCTKTRASASERTSERKFSIDVHFSRQEVGEREREGIASVGELQLMEIAFDDKRPL